MKTRKGFVANSSSASYYVTLSGHPSEVYETITENCWYPYIQAKELLESIQYYIDRTKERIEDLETKKEKFIYETKSELEEKLKKYEEYKHTIEFYQKNKVYPATVSMTKIALELDNIKVVERDTFVELSYMTVMHNSYAEGVTSFLQDIILYYSFERPNKISLRVEHNG